MASLIEREILYRLLLGDQIRTFWQIALTEPYAAGQPGDFLDQRELPRALQRRCRRGRGADEPLRIPSALQGRDIDGARAEILRVGPAQAPGGARPILTNSTLRRRVMPSATTAPQSSREHKGCPGRQWPATRRFAARRADVDALEASARPLDERDLREAALGGILVSVWAT